MSEVEENPYELGPELRRKSFEALHTLIRNVHSAVITEEQFSVGVDALFTAVSGLVPEPKVPEKVQLPASVKELPPAQRFIDLITACGDEIVHVNPIVKRVLFAPKHGIFKVFRWQAGQAFVDCTTCISGQSPAVKRLPFDTAALAQQALSKLADPGVMGKLGYVEISK